MAGGRLTQRHGGFRGQSLRRKTAWTFGPGSTAATQISAASTVGIGSGVAALVDGLTMIRIRGSVSAYLESASAAKDGFHCAIGIGVFTEEAFAAGVGSMPAPLTDVDRDLWLYHRFFDIHVAGAAVVDSFQSSIQFEIDSKAMRKWPESRVVGALIQVIEIGTATMQLFMDTRMLVKLA